MSSSSTNPRARRCSARSSSVMGYATLPRSLTERSVYPQDECGRERGPYNRGTDQPATGAHDSFPGSTDGGASGRPSRTPREGASAEDVVEGISDPTSTQVDSIVRSAFPPIAEYSFLADGWV